MTSYVNRHKENALIHDSADCCLLLRQSVDMEGLH